MEESKSSAVSKLIPHSKLLIMKLSLPVHSDFRALDFWPVKTTRWKVSRFSFGKLYSTETRRSSIGRFDAFGANVPNCTQELLVQMSLQAKLLLFTAACRRV